MKYLALAAALTLASCNQSPNATTETAPPAKQVAKSAVAAAPNAATMTAQIAAMEKAIDQGAASVNKVVMLERGDAKLYSTVGGDPAINGEYLYLALAGEPAQGWKVFRIGDFNSWELVEQRPDRAVLQVNRSAMDEPTGNIVTYEQNIAVALPKFEATEVQVTPVN